MKTLIIGGVAGGATAAARLRRIDKDMEIILVERGEYISYANCGLPYHVSDVIADRNSLLVTTPEVMRARYGVDVRVKNEALKIDKDNKKVEIKNLNTGEVYEESYDNLVISTGSSPLRPPIEGIDNDRIRSLWNVPDTDKIKEIIREKNVKSAVVVGGGFIGIEMAENLNHLGIKTSIVEKLNQVMGNLDYDMAQILHGNINDNGVNLYLGKGVTKFEDKNNGVKIHLDDGNAIEADLVILSIGVRPNSELARDAGLELNQRGGIVVDKYMRTSEKDIYAIGDVVEIEHFVDKTRAMIPLAGPANKQGRLLADTLIGNMKAYHGTQGTSVAQAFDMVAAATGYNEKQLKLKGMKPHEDYEVVFIQQKSHAGYYPGATPLFLKVIFDKKTEQILGAQVVGNDGADKRVDVIATAMRFNAKVTDLMHLELAYAPPFSSAKDPVNMVGYVAENIINGLVNLVPVEEYLEIKDGVVTLDVSEPIEREVKFIEGSIHIPFGQLMDRFGELDPEKTYVLYCGMGVRAYNSARILKMRGFKDVRVLAGGMSMYNAYRFEPVLHDFSDDDSCGCGQVYNGEDIKSEGDVIPVDCSGLQCPGPIMKVNQSMDGLEEGQVIKVSSTDMGFSKDVEAWCNKTGNKLLKKEKDGITNISYIQKGSKLRQVSNTKPSDDMGQTMVVFSGDLDKVLASFIIANGAAALGKPVTMFFTFWGLNALRKDQAVPVKKSFIEKMFGKMMPRGSKKLKLSKMNMAGMGTKMMKKVMNDKNVDSLEELMKAAMDNGVKLVACTMSMDVMGIKEEELIDGVEFAGVASYLGDAYDSQVNLFI